MFASHFVDASFGRSRLVAVVVVAVRIAMQRVVYSVASPRRMIHAVASARRINGRTHLRLEEHLLLPRGLQIDFPVRENHKSARNPKRDAILYIGRD